MELGFTNKLLLENEIATKRIKELEEENRKLKEELDKFSDAYKRYRDYEKEELADSLYDAEEQNKKLKEERDFFKEQAILWRKDYKNEYEENRTLNKEIEYRKDEFKELKKELKAKRELLRYYQKKS